jgi:hypothetical protein
MRDEDVEDFGLGERDDLDDDLRYIYCARISIGHTRLFLFGVMPIMPLRNDRDEQCPNLQRSLVKEHVSIETYSSKGWP